jgi:hypothetical protein
MSLSLSARIRGGADAPGTTAVSATGSNLVPETGLGVSTRSGGLGETMRAGGLGESMRSGLTHGTGIGDSLLSGLGSGSVRGGVHSPSTREVELKYYHSYWRWRLDGILSRKGWPESHGAL